MNFLNYLIYIFNELGNFIDLCEREEEKESKYIGLSTSILNNFHRLKLISFM